MSEIDELSEKVRALEADNATLVRGLEDLSMQVAKLSASATPLSETFRSGLEQLAGNVQRLCLQVRGHAGRHPGAALLAEMDALRKERDDLLEKNLTFQDRLAENTTLRARVAELEEDAKGWGEREEALTAEADHLRGVVTSRTEERDDFRHGCEVLTAERDALKGRVAELEKATTGLAGRLERAVEHGVTLGNAAVEIGAERDAALAKAASAREEVLEEAAQAVKALDEFDEFEDIQKAVAKVRALKTQPARRMLDAEKVGPLAWRIRTLVLARDIPPSTKLCDIRREVEALLSLAGLPVKP